ncbi:hypothetical protein C8R46DRAFT_1029333 [Mycena filopes]|nr:hypothetical protein C8R46DRAFT_1029333 [Mycena filopes]
MDGTPTDRSNQSRDAAFSRPWSHTAGHFAMPPHTCTSLPALWFAKVGDGPHVVVTAEFYIDPTLAATWGISSTFSTSLERTEPKITAHILCLPTEGLYALSNNTSVATASASETFATTVPRLQTQWPTHGTLCVRIGDKSWLPSQTSSAPLDVTESIHAGLNTVHFEQWSNMASYTYIMHAFLRKPLLHAAVPAFPVPGASSIQSGDSHSAVSRTSRSTDPGHWEYQPSNSAGARYPYSPRPMGPPPQQWVASPRAQNQLPHSTSTQSQQNWNHPGAVHPHTSLRGSDYVPVQAFHTPSFRHRPPLSAAHEPPIVQVRSGTFIPASVIHSFFQALRARLSDGTNHKEALNQLHGLAGYPDNMWKDYYLDNVERLEAAACGQASATPLLTPSAPTSSSRAVSMPQPKSRIVPPFLPPPTQTTPFNKMHPPRMSLLDPITGKIWPELA